MHDTWEDEPVNRSSIINYGLAMTASRMAEHLSATEDAVALSRASMDRGKILGLGFSMYAGSVLTAGIFEAAGLPATFGAMAGGVAGLFVDCSGILISEHFDEHNVSLTQGSDASERITARAKEFTNRPEVLEAFRGIVEIAVSK
jgi:hypothetical protein